MKLKMMNNNNNKVGLIILALCCLIVQCVGYRINKNNVDPKSISVVHLVFMNHLDVGFSLPNGNDIGYAFNVIDTYFDDYFPLAIQVANALRKRGGEERLVYTTHSWLVWLYLNCHALDSLELLPPGVIDCPSQSDLDDFIQTVKNGDITWHAWPFNLQAEFLTNKETLLAAQKITSDLDELFSNFTKPKTVISQRDVPGLTQAVIPYLSKTIRAISVGVNEASAPPNVPTTFLWKFEPTGDSIIGMWHPFGYGGYDIDDCVLVAGLDHALCWDFRGDNEGPPPNVSSVLSVFKSVQQEFPNANVIASTYENFVDALESVRDSLPVVTQEIGDTWIYGVASDPMKTAQFREIARLRQLCLLEKQCNTDDFNFKIFDFMLLKLSEHTWGLDIKTYLKDFTNWNNTQFYPIINDSRYLNVMEGWIEQRNYLEPATRSVQDMPFNHLWEEKLNDIISPPLPDITGYFPLQKESFGNIINWRDLQIGFDAHGAITTLIDTTTGLKWASNSNPLSLFIYTTFSQQDIQLFLSEYLACNPSSCTWAPPDYGKPNMVSVDNVFLPTLNQIYISPNNQTVLSLFFQLTLPSVALVNYGAPEQIWIQYNFSSPSDVNITYTLINKVPTRLTEAIWVLFKPVEPVGGGKWFVNKLGIDIDPLNVVLNGSKHIHAVGEGIKMFVNNNTNSINIKALDSPVVSIGNPSPYPTPVQTTALVHEGWFFNLFNNAWGTNYIMWYPYLPQDSNLRYRFQLSLS